MFGSFTAEKTMYGKLSLSHLKTYYKLEKIFFYCFHKACDVQQAVNKNIKIIRER